MATTSTIAAPMMAGDPAADQARRVGLRKMRTIAVSLLVGAAVVFLVTVGQDGALGFVNAGAEASMVGAIADWFAVTALFKHPLGLPIPHTALIPRRKDDLGRSLEEFVGENFLQEDVIRERITTATISLRIGSWLAVPANAQRVVDEIADVGAIALSRVRQEHVELVVREALVPRFHEEPISPLLGSLLTEVLRDDMHHGLVDLALEELHGWLLANPDTVTEVLLERAPWWTPDRLNDRVSNRILREIVEWVADIRDEPRHRARQALDSLLTQLGHDLLEDPDTQQRTEKLKDRLLDQPQVVGTAVSLWDALRRVMTASLQDPEGALRTRALAELARFAVRLEEDAQLRARLDGLAADAVVFGVERYGEEVTAVITQTIERWDGKQAAERIELHVGRDLQFIRINGTIVGGLVGAGHPRRQRGAHVRFGRRRAEAEPAEPAPVDVPIRDEVIRLGQFLKLANLVDTGAEAKPVIAAGEVTVNGEVELRRGRQLHVGDVVTLGGMSSRVAGGDVPDDLPW